MRLKSLPLRLNQVVLKGSFLTYPRRKLFFKQLLVHLNGNKVFFTKRSVTIHLTVGQNLFDLKQLRTAVKNKIEKILEGETVIFLTLKVVNIHTSQTWPTKLDLSFKILARKLMREKEILKVIRCEAAQEQNLGSQTDFESFLPGGRNEYQLTQLFHLFLTFKDEEFPNTSPVVRIFPGRKGSCATNVTFICSVVDVTIS